MGVYIRQLSFQDGKPADGGDVRRELDILANSVNNITSAQITDGTIVNADINAAAAIDISKTTLGTYIAPTSVPSSVWKGSTGTPSLGNGTWVGTYSQIGKKVFFHYALNWGTTTSTAGAGNWIFDLPGGLTSSVSSAISFLAFDTSANNGTVGLGRIDGGSTQVIRVYAGAALGEGSPFAWANTDFFYMTGFFEVA